MASLRILCQIDFPTVTSRLWDGSGPYIDADGEVWRGAQTLVGLDALEAAVNGDAATLGMALSGVDAAIADRIWADYQAGAIIGSRVRIFTQECDNNDQPVGSPDTDFTGRIDNIRFDDAVTGLTSASTITVDVVNRFTLRRLTNGAVLSDVDQRARSAILNPTAPPDLFLERVNLLADKTIRWPRFS